MCAISMSFATSQFSHCYLYCGMRKKHVGHYFLSNPRSFLTSSLSSVSIAVSSAYRWLFIVLPPIFIPMLSSKSTLLNISIYIALRKSTFNLFPVAVWNLIVNNCIINKHSKVSHEYVILSTNEISQQSHKILVYLIALYSLYGLPGRMWRWGRYNCNPWYWSVSVTRVARSVIANDVCNLCV